LSNIYANTETTTASITNTTEDNDSNSFLAQPPKDLNYYWVELTGLWRKTTGRVFSQAKDDLTPGEYKALMAEFGFERSIAARLRAIYHCLEDVDNYLQKRLPASVSTIYEMSKVGPELLGAKTETGGMVNNNHPGRHSTSQAQQRVIPCQSISAVLSRQTPGGDDR